MATNDNKTGVISEFQVINNEDKPCDTQSVVSEPSSIKSGCSTASGIPKLSGIKPPSKIGRMCPSQKPPVPATPKSEFFHFGFRLWRVYYVQLYQALSNFVCDFP